MLQRSWFSRLILWFSLTMLTFTSGCVDKTTPPSTQNQPVQPSSQQVKGDKAPIPFTIVDLDTVPKELKQLANQNREKATATGMELGGRAYLLVTRGAKRSGGYGVEITNVTQETRGGRPVIVVGVKYTDPKPDQIVTAVITYPMVAAQLNLKAIPYGLSFFFTTD
ncbi:MAG: protease complex subunit PrcB family protein [Carboxydocellales bacterium]